MWRRGEDRDGMELVAECEAFLSGCFAHYHEVRAQHAPVWAWTNLLAHGRLEDLQRAHRLLGSGRHRSLPNGDWCEAQSYLAGEVLAQVEGGGSLQELQARILIPLELRLAAERDTVRVTPVQLVAIVLDAFERDRNIVRRPSGIRNARRDPPSSV